MASDFQYDAKAKPAARTRANTAPIHPNPARYPATAPTSTVISTKPATRRTERRLLARISSNTGRVPREWCQKTDSWPDQNSTVGTVRAASSASKYSRGSNFSIRA